jgi:regulator of sigma E protease
MSYIVTLLLIGFVIFFHELGHFLAARLAGIPIQVFSIGFGPKVWAMKRGATEYRISLIPLGGYVLPEVLDETEFFNYPVTKRMIMSAGGPLASIILPIVCFVMINLIVSPFSFNNILIQPVYQTISVLYQMILAIPSAFSHTENLSGVIGIVATGGDFIGINNLKALQFTALMSLNLAVLNLLSVPALDGGKILLYLLELVYPKSLRFHYPLALAGWVMILGLMVYVTAADVGRYFIACLEVITTYIT